MYSRILQCVCALVRMLVVTQSQQCCYSDSVTRLIVSEVSNVYYKDSEIDSVQFFVFVFFGERTS